MNNKELDAEMSDIIDQLNSYVYDRIKSEPNLRLSKTQMAETFILTKLAEFQLRLRQLENNKTVN